MFLLSEEMARLKDSKATKIAMSRAKSASKENLDTYFKELGTIFIINDFKNHPEKTLNVDEPEVRTEHSPKIVCARNSSAQHDTSPRTYNVTII